MIGVNHCQQQLCWRDLPAESVGGGEAGIDDGVRAGSDPQSSVDRRICDAPGHFQGMSQAGFLHRLPEQS